MRMWQKITLIAIILSLLFISCRSGMIAFSSSDVTANEGIEEARAKLREAFNATVDAEIIGTNVDEAVKNLSKALEYINQAENLINQGDLEQAANLTQTSIQLSEETITMVQELKRQTGLLNFYTKLILPVVAAVILLGIGAYAFFFGRRVWKKRQEKKFMEMEVKTSNKTMLNSSKATDSLKDTNEEKMILVAVLSAIIIIAGLLVYVSMTPAPQENFASINLLNSEKKANNYPELLILGRNNTFLLWVDVENFMNRIEYGNIHVKIANISIPTETPPQETILSLERILVNGEKWESPVSMTINKTGAYKITFELWLYDEMKAVFTNANFCGLQLKVVSET
jgi:hypothetical protein